MKKFLLIVKLLTGVIFLLFSISGCNDASDGFFTKEGKFSGTNNDGLKDAGDDPGAIKPPSDDDSSDKSNNEEDKDDQDDDKNDNGSNDQNKGDDNDKDCDKQGDKDKEHSPCPDKISREKLLDGSIDWRSIACDEHKVAICVERKIKKSKNKFKIQFIDHHGLQGVLKEKEKSFALDCNDIHPIKGILKGPMKDDDCNCK